MDSPVDEYVGPDSRQYVNNPPVPERDYVRQDPQRQASTISTDSGYLQPTSNRPTSEPPENAPSYYNVRPPAPPPAQPEAEIDSDPQQRAPTPEVQLPRPADAASGKKPSNAYSRKAYVKKRKHTRKRKEMEYHPGTLQFGVEDVPPWYLCILLGFQHYLIMFGATVTNPLVLAPALCIADDDSETKSELIGTIFVVAGISTLLQTTLGVRLPIVQGGTFTFVIPSFAILSLPHWKCPAASDALAAINVTGTQSPLNETGVEPLWLPRIREIQGAIMLASLVQVVIGVTGLMGFLLRFIGPLAITPTIALAGLALFDVAASYSSKQWWITLVTVVLIVAFSQYTKNIEIPCFHFQRGQGCQKDSFPIFRLFPVILAISITWALCAILTAANVFPSNEESWGYGAQTNLRIDVLEKAPWFRVPYPGQWGTPTFSSAGVLGMLAGVLASMVESVGDYYACARMSKVSPPPIHAINRGLAIEGFACVLAGAFGSGTGTTTYSENIGAIGITKVASRRVIQCGGLIMILFGVVAKFGAIFVTIPDPIVGGTFIVMFGMVTAVGLSNLQFVDLNSSRNLFIIGFSFFFGLTLPRYLQETPGAIRTGSEEVDQILTVLLKTSMFVGGMAGFVLDNSIPGTDEERGMTKWRQEITEGVRRDQPPENPLEVYEIASWSRFFRRFAICRYLPFMPMFEVSITDLCKRKRTGEYNLRQDRRRPRDDSTAV